MAATVGAAVMTIAMLTPAANAQPSSTAPDTARKLCEQRIPKLEERANRLLTRITGGPEVHGSSAWLLARSEKAKARGDAAQADWLAGKAANRGARAELLRQTQQRLTDFKQKHCGK
jgi:hypothetical protein